MTPCIFHHTDSKTLCGGRLCFGIKMDYCFVILCRTTVSDHWHYHTGPIFHHMFRFEIWQQGNAWTHAIYFLLNCELMVYPNSTVVHFTKFDASAWQCSCGSVSTKICQLWDGLDRSKFPPRNLSNQWQLWQYDMALEYILVMFLRALVGGASPTKCVQHAMVDMLFVYFHVGWCLHS